MSALLPRRLPLLLLPMVYFSACGPEPTPLALLDWSQTVSPSSAPSKQMPSLRVDGNRILEAVSGGPVRLRGVNVCSLEFDRQGLNWKARTGPEVSEVIRILSDPQRWKANAIRMPVNQEWFLGDDAYVELVEKLIDEANSHGLYVLLDVQWEVGAKLEPYHRNILELPTFGEGNTTEAFWHKATGRWSNRTNLLYDLINEPHGHSDTTTALFMQTLVDAIRLRDQKTVIVIAGMDWAHSVDYYREHPLRGENLVYSAHQYLPHDPPESFPLRFAHAAKQRAVLLGEFLAEEGQTQYAQQLVEAAESSEVNGWLPWAIGCGFDENDDSKKDTLIYLSRKMRELNP